MGDLIGRLCLKELLHYNSDTGQFTWLESRGSVKAGEIAGSVNPKGYRVIGILGKLYLAHRLAFLYMTGEWPREQVDHRNRLPDDNCWLNLRPATRSQNARNSRPYGTSRFKGVSWHKHRGKWQAQAKFNAKLHYLGNHVTEEAAAAAYRQFAAANFPEYMRLT